MEKWQEYYSNQELVKIHQIGIINLKIIKNICDELGIQFFLYGGSLLGAIKYKGFIPWDDDLDIGMMRNDYEIFVKNAPRILPSTHFLQTPYNDKRTPYFYSKLRVCGTKYVEREHSHLKIEHGIYADIYPIDGCPNDSKSFTRFHLKYQRLLRAYYFKHVPYSSNGEKTARHYAKSIVRFAIYLLFHLYPHKILVRRLDAISTKFNGKEDVVFGNYNFPLPCNFFDAIYPLEKTLFEGVEVNIPRGWNTNLSNRYGRDYMSKLPPEDQRIGHKPYFLDFGEY